MRYLFLFALFFNSIIGSSNTFDNAKPVDTSKHFYSVVDKAEFDTLKGSDFTWIIFQPINDTLSYTPFDEKPAFIEKLSEKQKALFYLLELERAVYGGQYGFVNFYWNYKSYYQETIKGLKLINDTAMLNVLEGVNKVYLSNRKTINRKLNSDWKYVQKLFKKYDEAFLDKHEETMKLLEEYIRLNANEFVRFKN